MKTQRANVYRTVGVDGRKVFFIEEWRPGVDGWMTVGDTYDSFGSAETMVISFNLAQLASKVAEWSLPR